MTFEKMILQRLKKYAKKFGISDYSYKVEIRDSKKKSTDDYDTYGYVIIDEETRQVVLNVNKKLLTKEPHEIDKTIVHELLHVRFSELLTLFNVILALHVRDKKSRKVYTKQIDTLEHKIIVALTEAIGKKK